MRLAQIGNCHILSAVLLLIFNPANFYHYPFVKQREINIKCDGTYMYTLLFSVT